MKKHSCECFKKNTELATTTVKPIKSVYCLFRRSTVTGTNTGLCVSLAKWM